MLLFTPEQIERKFESLERKICCQLGLSGTYTPVFSNLQNLTAVSVYENPFFYSQIGKVVNVSGVIQIQNITPGNSSYFEMTIPIAKTFASSTDAAGSGVAQSGDTALIIGEFASTTVLVQWEASVNFNPQYMTINFSYLLD